jgi:hypothetical protein
MSLIKLFLAGYTLQNFCLGRVYSFGPRILLPKWRFQENPEIPEYMYSLPEGR